MEQPIFILSSPRSGSTLLRYILDTHPAIYAPPELSLGPLARALDIALAGLNGKIPSAPPLGVDDPEILALVADAVSRLMDEHARRRGKSVWCEKSPQNMGEVALLTSLYPEARYICLYRNHLDTIESCLDSSRYVVLPPLVEYFARNPRLPLRATAEHWIDVTTKLVELERSGRHPTHRLRYEDLVRQPQETLAALFSFLGLAWDPSLVDAVYRTRHDHGRGDVRARLDNRIRTDSIGRGRALPSELVADEQRARIEELNSELGYVELIRELLAAPAPAGASGEAEAAPPANGRGPRWVFETHLPARFEECPEELAALNGSYRFLISGEGGGSWLLLPAEGGGLKVLAGNGTDGEATTTIGLDASDLLGIVEGRLHVVRLQLDGRLTFRGEPLEMEQAQSLVTLFRAEA
jgi:protein-tyrosine sulfotransferase